MRPERRIGSRERGPILGIGAVAASARTAVTLFFLHWWNYFHRELICISHS